MHFDDVICSGQVRLYRFYNIEKSKYGEPFALCDAHRKEQPIPAYCTIEKIANDADWPCSRAE